jgi:hypothetical protein
MFDQGSTITPSSDAEWKAYYQRKHIECNKQLEYLANAFSHMLRFAMEGKKEDAHLLARRVARRLEYPRDKQPVLDELNKWPQYAGSVLREEDGSN